MSSNAERLKEERRICAQALLNLFWIRKDNEPDLFQAVRNHYEALQEWFQEYCGFTLLVTRHFAKLEKMPGKPRNWMGLSLFRQPRDYGLFTYCLWFLEGRGENDQFLLTELVEEIREHLVGRDVFLDWTIYDHRLSMARALKLLKEMGVLATVDGDEGEWARSGSEGDNVLYECTPWSRYVLRRFSKDLQSYPDLDSLGEGMYADTPEGQLKRRRHRIYRRLIQEPVIYDWEWSDDERYYVRNQRRLISEQLENMLGLQLERYQEGMLVFYSESGSDAQLFPSARALSDLALLLGGEIRRMLAHPDGGLYVDSQGRIEVTEVEIEGILLRLREKHHSFWSKQHRQATARELAGDLLQHLVEWGMAAQADPQRWWLCPALGRWNGDYDSFSDAEGIS